MTKTFTLPLAALLAASLAACGPGGDGSPRGDAAVARDLDMAGKAPQRSAPKRHEETGQQPERTEEPMQLPMTLGQTTKKRSVSTGQPGPPIRVHQPGLPVIGCVEATY